MLPRLMQPQRIDELYARGADRGEPVVSFEFFPPKSADADAQLEDALRKLRPLGPAYVSVTYGAGGSTREKTVDLVGRIRREWGLLPMAHLTCVGATRDEIGGVLSRLHAIGIENVLALRGDPPKGAAKFEATAGGFRYASELAAFVRKDGRFAVGGACYPEGHPETRDVAAGVAHLKQKVDAGARFLLTQLFFDPRAYFDFAARARAAGITVPIVPGVMPVTNVDQLERFTSMCGASIPPDLRERLDRVRDDPQVVMNVGVDHATWQCEQLLRGGAPGIHFYTLNKSPSARAVFENLRHRRLVPRGP
jgi:methylenetetrahydrofolate reductase (NADPH)